MTASPQRTGSHYVARMCRAHSLDVAVQRLYGTKMSIIVNMNSIGFQTVARISLALVLYNYSSGLWAGCDAPFDDLLKLPLEQLLDTGVSVASKVSTDPDKQPASVTVVSHQQLQLSGARTLNEAWQGGMEYAFNDESHEAYVHVNESNYAGQALRYEGWAENRAFLGASGGVVADASHRLKRSDNLSVLGHFRYHQLNLDVLHTDQTRDLYNFYVDRDQLEQAVTYFGLSHHWDIHPGIALDTKADVTVDDYTLHSVMQNAISGGTRENHYGLQAVLRLKELWRGNTLALGSEFHSYDLGENNGYGDNFIVNVMSPQNIAQLDALKQSNTFVYPNNINVYSLFLEDNYEINQRLTLFGGLRYDQHKNWGQNLSPRLGFFYYPWQDGQFRVSYSQGFRGAVGLNYSGGFRHDGLLREANFDKVSSANLPGYDNFQATQPEKMEAMELAFNQRFNSHWQWENVLFYNQVKNIIGVASIRGNDLGIVVPQSIIETCC